MPRRRTSLLRVGCDVVAVESIPPQVAVATNEYQSLLLLLTEIRGDLKHALTRGEDHETRIRQLERKVWTAGGIVGLLTGTIGALVAKAIGG